MRSKLYQIGIRHLLLMQEFVVIALTDKDEKTCAHIAMELTKAEFAGIVLFPRIVYIKDRILMFFVFAIFSSSRTPGTGAQDELSQLRCNTL